MKNTILARRYAKALFSLGKQEGKGEEYSEKLSAIAELFHDEAAGVRDALANPLYPLDMRQQVMVKIAENVQAAQRFWWAGVWKSTRRMHARASVQSVFWSKPCAF